MENKIKNRPHSFIKIYFVRNFTRVRVIAWNESKKPGSGKASKRQEQLENVLAAISQPSVLTKNNLNNVTIQQFHDSWIYDDVKINPTELAQIPTLRVF